ncbi:MAG: NifB/NifX family molybdenum-iron cluster-binding protein [Chitinivibrionales bacterium]
MKIAVSSQGKSPDSLMDSRFGRASFFLVFDSGTDTFETLDNEQNLQSTQGAGIQAASTVVNAGCDCLITGHCGPKAFAALSKAGVAVYTGCEGSIKDVIEKFQQGKLTKSVQPDVQGHW